MAGNYHWGVFFKDPDRDLDRSKSDGFMRGRIIHDLEGKGPPHPLPSGQCTGIASPGGADISCLNLLTPRLGEPVNTPAGCYPCLNQGLPHELKIIETREITLKTLLGPRHNRRRPWISSLALQPHFPSLCLGKQAVQEHLGRIVPRFHGPDTLLRAAFKPGAMQLEQVSRTSRKSMQFTFEDQDGWISWIRIRTSHSTDDPDPPVRGQKPRSLPAAPVRQ